MYVDVGTPAEMWDILRKEVETFIEGHRDNFGGKSAIYCFGAADPLKLSVQVVVEYSFDGELSPLLISRCSCQESHAVTFLLMSGTGCASCGLCQVFTAACWDAIQLIGSPPPPSHPSA